MWRFLAVVLGCAAAKGPALKPKPQLTLRQHALAGAIARYVVAVISNGAERCGRCAAQSAVHPLNVAKTLLQTQGGGAILRSALAAPLRAGPVLLRGLRAQALLSLPNGALNFCAMEGSKRALERFLEACDIKPPKGVIDLCSASIGTATATLVSLPQSVLNDRIMAGAHSGLGDALKSIGVRGLYPMKTWNAALVAKVPAYSLNWVVYQHLRRWRAKNKPEHLRGEHASPVEDVIIGAIASSLSVCIMIPFDTIKVRMTTNNIGFIPYTGVGNALRRMLAEEGLICFYRGLPPRLLSVVPMTAIQFAIYEVCKRRIPDVEQSLRNMLSQKSLQPALTGFEASEAAR